MNGREIERYRDNNGNNVTVVDSVIENVTNSRPVVSFVNWLKVLGSLAFLATIGVGLWSIRDTWGIIGAIVFWVAGSIILVAGFCLIAIMLSFTIGYVTRVQSYIPHETGVWLRDMFGRMSPLAPLKETTAKQAKEAQEGKTQVNNSVPTLAQLLESTIVPGMQQLLLGFAENYSEVWGIWDDLKSFAIYGFGRVGKTNTMLYYILQAVLGMATVAVCDIHRSKPTGLVNMLRPLGKWIQFAISPEEILEVFEQYNDELERRKACEPNTFFEIWILFADEWNGILDMMSKKDKEYVVWVAEKICREAGGYGMYCSLAIHELDNKSVGSANLRRLFMGVVCHALEISYAKYVFNVAKYQKMVTALGKGEILLRNADTREVSKIRIPKCTAKDIVTVALKLDEYETGVNAPSPNELLETTEDTYLPRTADANHQLEGPKKTRTTDQLTEQLAEHTYPAGSTSRSTSSTVELSTSETGREVRREVAGNDFTMTDTTPNSELVRVLRYVGKLIKEEGLTDVEIRKRLAPNDKGGRALQELNTAIQYIRQYGVPEEEQAETETH